MTVQIRKAQTPWLNADGTVNREWYRFLSQLANFANESGVVVSPVLFSDESEGDEGWNLPFGPQYPGGGAGSVLYNYGNSFYGDSNFTYNNASYTLSLAPAGSNIHAFITNVSPLSGVDASSITVLGQSATTSTNAGGSISIIAGNGVTTGLAGTVNLTAGDSYIGGNVVINAGKGTSSIGGILYLNGGISVSGSGGSADISGGASSNGGNGATINCGGGLSSGIGGTLTFTAGSGGVSASSGVIQLVAGIGATTVQVADNGSSAQLGFYNISPVTQQTTSVSSATVSNTTTIGLATGLVTTSTTFDGYTVAQIVRLVRNLGLAS